MTRDGCCRLLADLTPAHRANVYACLHRAAKVLWARAAMDELVDASIGQLYATIGVGAPLIGDCEPHAWLDATPLMRAIRSLEHVAPDDSASQEPPGGAGTPSF